MTMIVSGSDGLTFPDASAQTTAALVTPTAVSDQANSSTGYFDLPAGTTAQRPGSPAVGMVRYNTSFGNYEAYTATGWHIVSTAGYTYSADYLLVAGGGGGGTGDGGLQAGVGAPGGSGIVIVVVG
jgi:hypothetical protein